MNFKVYFFVSCLPFVLLTVLLGLSKTFWVYSCLHAIFITSFLLLFYFGKIVMEAMKKEKASRKDITMAVFLFIMKNILIISAFYLGHVFIGKEVVWASALYLTQLGIFTVVMKKYDIGKLAA